MKSGIKLFLAGIVLVFVIFLAYVQTKEPAEKMKIGVIVPLSGEVAALGEKTKNGIELALEESGQAEKIDFVFEDGGIETKKALTAYKKLSTVNAVSIYIGPFGPDQILTVAPSLQPDDVMLGVSLCENRLVEFRQVYCTYPSIPDQIRSVLPVINKHQVNKVGLITENSELGNIIEDELRKLETEGGYQVVIVEKMKRSDKDFRTQLTKIKASGANGVLAATLPDEGYLILKQLSELGFNGTKMAIFDAVEEILKDLGPAAEGVYLPGHISPVFEESFAQNYKEKYGQEADMYSALGHSIAKILIAALEENDFEKSDLQKKLVGRTDKTAIVGFKFREDHTVSVPVQSLIFQDGKIRQFDY